ACSVGVELPGARGSGRGGQHVDITGTLRWLPKKRGFDKRLLLLVGDALVLGAVVAVVALYARRRTRRPRRRSNSACARCAGGVGHIACEPAGWSVPAQRPLREPAK